MNRVDILQRTAFSCLIVLAYSQLSPSAALGQAKPKPVAGKPNPQPEAAPKPAAEKPKPQPEDSPSSYDQVSPVLLGKQTFAAMMADDKAKKADVMAAHQKVLEERYNLKAQTDAKLKMTRGKPIAVGPTVKLPEGKTWDKLAAMSPADIRDQGAFPQGFLPLPHPHHAVGGMVFPQAELKELPRLTRFDLDFDLPDAFLPEFPPAMFLTTAKTWETSRKAK